MRPSVRSLEMPELPPPLLTSQDAIMKLYSEQSHDLRQIKGRRDRELGTYSSIPSIASAQNRLYDEILGTDQIIWCRLDVPAEGFSQSTLLHVINGHENDIVAILDGMIWAWIIGHHCIPNEEWDRIRFVTSHLHPSVRDIRREELKAIYAIDNLPDDLWDNLLVDDIFCDMPEILLRWPLKKSKIVEVKRF